MLKPFRPLGSFSNNPLKSVVARALIIVTIFALGSPAGSVASAQGGAQGSQALDSISLRPIYQEGSTARFSMWTDRTSTMTISDGTESQDLETLYHIEAEVTWTVRRTKADGSAECVLVYEWLVIDVTGPDGSELKNDSRRSSGDAPPLHDLLRAIAGKELVFTMAADGSAESVRGVQAIRAALDMPEMSPSEDEFLDTARSLAFWMRPLTVPAVARLGAPSTTKPMS